MSFLRKKMKFVKALHELSNSSKKVLFGIVAALFIIHIFLSIFLADFTWFAAFGASISILGLLTSFSYALPSEKIHPEDLDPMLEGLHYAVGGSPMADHVTDTETIDRIKQSNIARLLRKFENISTYIIFTVLGTIIWVDAGFLNEVSTSFVSQSKAASPCGLDALSRAAILGVKADK